MDDLGSSAGFVMNQSLFFIFIYFIITIIIIIIIVFFAISWAAPTAYGGSEARGRIGAVAAGLHHSHNNWGSQPCLQPTPQLTATLDPWPTEQGQGWNLQPHGSYRIC